MDTSETDSTNVAEPTMPRRDFIKIAARFAASGLVGAALHNEIKKGSEGVVTEIGSFIPLYERHDIGINAEDIPQHTDVYFREYIISQDNNNYVMDVEPKKILLSETEVYVNTKIESSVRVFPDEILNKLAQQGTEIMLGDTLIGDYAETEALKLLRQLQIAESFLGAFGLTASLQMEKSTRRNLLRKVSLASIAWGVSPLLSNELSYSDIGERSQNSAKRISARIKGLVSDFHPEDAMVFFRNAVMANKLLTVAAAMNQSNSAKEPILAFHVESGHSGIEDFLQLGSEVTRRIISAYPKSFLREMVQINGGIEKFCSSRLLRLPSIFHAENGQISDVMLNHISDRTVVDSELKEILEKVLA